MILLSSLLGMMVLGSLAFISTGPDVDPMDDEDELERTPDEEEDLAMSEDAQEDDQSVADTDLQTARSVTTAPSEPVGDPTPDISPDGVLSDDPEGPEDPDQDDIADSILGTENDDALTGTGDTDTVLGGEGDDTLLGLGGADDLYGDGGNDSLAGGSDQDTLMGGDGDDMLSGGRGDDALHGRAGADTLIGDAGDDTLYGGTGDDLLSGVQRAADGTDQDEQDYLNGGADDDTIIAGDTDIVSLGAGADVLVLGEWMVDEGAQVLDFNDDEDQLMVVYDDDAHGDAPEVALRLNASDPSLTEIVLGDEVLATLPTEDAPDIDNIVLIGESSMEDTGFAALVARSAG